MALLRDWIMALPAEGRFTFSTAEARAHEPRISIGAATAVLGRAAADRLIVSPIRGFHVVLPLEDRGIGVPSWRLFLDPMMAHLQLPYYVGLLTGAAIHGASSQSAQRVQIVVPRPHRPIEIGRLAIEFVVRRTAARAPINLVTTPTGRLRVGTPEVVALDVVRYPARSGGIGNVVTVLRDLMPSMRPVGMRKALALEPATADLQRLGHLLSRLGAADIAGVLADALEGRRLASVPLAADGEVPLAEAERDPRWRVVTNTIPEAD